MTRIITGTVSVDPGGSIVTAWVNPDGLVLSEITAPAGSTVVIEGRANFIKVRLSTTSFELLLPHAGEGGVDLDCAISALTAGETQIGTLNARTATVIQRLGVLDANGRGLFYNLIGATGDNDPGPGRMAFNNADPELVTELYLDVLDANEGGRDVSGLLGLWVPGTTLIVRSIATTAYAAFRLVAAPEDAGGYRLVVVEHVGSDGTLAAEPVAVEWLISGSGMEIGAVGPFAERVDFNGETHPFVYASVDGDGAAITTSVLFQKRSLAPDDWSAPLPFQGFKGDMGHRGWTMLLASVPDGDRRVERVVGYFGGEGEAPTFGIGLYRGLDGLVADIADATDIRGGQGLAGTIDGLTTFMQERVTEDENSDDTRAALNIVLSDKPTAEAGLNSEQFMTPLTTAQAILALSPPSDTSELETTVSMLALLVSDNANVALFLGPTGNRIADSFDALTYVDVAGATNLDTSAPGVLKPTPQELWISGGTPTLFGGAANAANINDDNPATVATFPVSGTLTGATIFTRTVARIDLGSLKTITKMELVGWQNSVSAVAGYEFYTSVDDTTYVAFGTAFPAPTGGVANTVRTGSISARYIRLVAPATNFGGGHSHTIADFKAYEVSGAHNLTVRSASFAAAAPPTKMKALLRVKEVTASVAGTDYTLECSRDNGTTWAAMALSEMFVTGGLLYVDGAETSVSGQPSGTAPRWRFKTLNNKNVELHDVYLYWS